MISEIIQKLVDQALAQKLIEKEDEIYARNQILALLNLSEFQRPETLSAEKSLIPNLLALTADYACEKGIIRDSQTDREIILSKIMNCFLPRPSEVNRRFFEKYAQNPQMATHYFHELSKNSSCIQMKQNIEFKVSSIYGELDITINLVKPEKDPVSIAHEQALKSITYPKCLLCIENEGYAGRARSNHRMIRLQLLGENWFLQYSPYMYYNEHCIVLSEKHTNMKMNKMTLSRLLAFVEQFPHYFLGSNAELPIVGGSILSHDHYQGGRYEFALAKAACDWSFFMGGFPKIECLVLKWPMPVIRLHSANKSDLAAAGDFILQKWKSHHDEGLGILATTNETPHSTITPIARKSGDLFELDLVLRNNRTSVEHPLGIFHPHADIHHIKKENIGLIEVMGLAVLPARLKNELKEVAKFINGKANRIADCHLTWAQDLSARYHGESSEESFVLEEAGKKFLKALEDAAVFKQNTAGRTGFRRFIETLR